MTHKRKIFENPFQPFRGDTDSRIVAKFRESRPLGTGKLPKSRPVYRTEKNRLGRTRPSEPPLGRSRPKFRESCRLLTCVYVPTLVQIGCGLPDLFPKEMIFRTLKSNYLQPVTFMSEVKSEYRNL